MQIAAWRCDLEARHIRKPGVVPYRANTLGARVGHWELWAISLRHSFRFLLANTEMSLSDTICRAAETAALLATIRKH